jgi:hypothetical protein
MRRSPALIFAVVTAAVACCGLAAGAGSAAGATLVLDSPLAVGSWSAAQEVPGSAALNAGGNAMVNSVSCTSPGKCAAGGSYSDSSGNTQAFVVDEVRGSWGAAQEVPGSAALNAGGNAMVNSVSCTSPGNCAAGGSYSDSSGNTQAFVVDEVRGSWGAAQEVPGSAALNAGGNAMVNSVSCTSPGNCVAGGSYSDSSNNSQAFVVDEVRGSWGPAQEVPGSAALNAGGGAQVTSVSCTSPGNCAAGGSYSDSSNNSQAFVVDEAYGSWGSAQEVPGSAALNAGGYALVTSVSCTSPGNCVAGGHYSDSAGHFQAFVVGEVRGSWGAAQEVPGSAALNAGGNARITSVWCVPAGNCVAGGSYRDSSNHSQAFVVDEDYGSWGAAREVPGSAALNAGGFALVASVSCTSPGNCVAGGGYRDSAGNAQAFVVGEVRGSWGAAQEVPGSAALNVGGNARVTSVSCVSAGNCVAGGGYRDSAGNAQAFVVGEVRGSWGAAQEVPGSAALNVGGGAQVTWVSCVPAGDCAVGGSYTDSSGSSQAFVDENT